jgi:signal peptidase I
MRFRRFLVEGESMLPTLEPGDFVVGTRVTQVEPMQIVAFQHPGRPGFWLIKRVIATSGRIDLDEGTLDGAPYRDPRRDPLFESGCQDIASGTMFVLSDNRSSTRADSRVFGTIPVLDAHRIRFRYWPMPGRL